MASFIHTLFNSSQRFFKAWVLLCVVFVAVLWLSHANGNWTSPLSTWLTPSSNQAVALSNKHHTIHTASSVSDVNIQHCQNSNGAPNCAAPQHHSNDCLWQCLLVCMAHMLLFALCLISGLKTRLLAYAKLSLCFKSSMLKRLLKPPKNPMVCA